MGKSKEIDGASDTTKPKGTKNEISIERQSIDCFLEIIAPLVCSHRFLLAFLAFLGFFLCYAQRNGLAYESNMDENIHHIYSISFF